MYCCSRPTTTIPPLLKERRKDYLLQYDTAQQLPICPVQTLFSFYLCYCSLLYVPFHNYLCIDRTFVWHAMGKTEQNRTYRRGGTTSRCRRSPPIDNSVFIVHVTRNAGIQNNYVAPIGENKTREVSRNNKPENCAHHTNDI